MKKEKMHAVLLRLIAEYKQGTPYEVIAEVLNTDFPNIKNFNVTWVKNMTRRLREEDVIFTEDRGIGWGKAIKELSPKKSETEDHASETRSAPNADVPDHLLLPDAKEYRPYSRSSTERIMPGFQRFSAIARILYIGQLTAWARRDEVDVKSALDEALRIWIKIKAIATTRGLSIDEVAERAKEIVK